MKRRFPEKQVIRERIKWKTNISLVFCREITPQRGQFGQHEQWTLRKRIFCSCFEVLYNFARMDYLSSLINGRSETCFSPKIFQSVQTLTKADGIGRENISPKQDFQWRAHCIVNEFVGLSQQGGTICGAIEGSRRSLKSIDKRVFANFRDKNAVFINFCDKNAVFTNFCDKHAVFTHFRDKMPYLQIFATKITFLNYMTQTQCLALILSVQDRINQSIANLLDW